MVAILALVVAMTGTSYALTLPKNSVGAKQIKAGAVRASEVQDGSLGLNEFRPGTVPVVLWADITPGTSPSISFGNGVTGVSWSSSYYIVTFNQDVSGCAALASTNGDIGNNTDSRINIAKRSGAADQVNVRTYVGAADTSVSTLRFSVAMVC